MRTQINQYTLSNGIIVLIDPKDILTTGFEIHFGMGADIEPLALYGITHFLEHLLLDKSRDFASFPELSKHLESNGGTINAYTDKQDMWISGRILSENLSILMNVIAGQIQNPLLGENIERERKVILNELARGQDNNIKTFIEFKYQKLFPDSGMDHWALGNMDTISNITKTDIQEYFNQNLSAQNTIICVSGKIDNEPELLKQLESLFSFIPRTHDRPKSQSAVWSGYAHNNVANQQNTKLCIAFDYPITKNLKNRKQIAAMGLFKQIFNRRLFDTIREKNALSYGINVGFSGDAHIGTNTINTEVSADNLERTIALIANTSRDILSTHPADAAELSRAKMISKYKFAKWSENPTAAPTQFVDFWQTYGAVFNADTELETIKSVSLQEVCDIAQSFFSATPCILTQGTTESDNLLNIWNDNFQN